MINQTEVALAVIGLVGTGFGVFKYLFSQIGAMQKEFLSSQSEQQRKLFEYVETKNGHLERISERFAESSDRMSDKLGELVRVIDKLK